MILHFLHKDLKMLELPVDEPKDVEFRNDGLNLDWRARSQMTTMTSWNGRPKL